MDYHLKYGAFLLRKEGYILNRIFLVTKSTMLLRELCVVLQV